MSLEILLAIIVLPPVLLLGLLVLWALISALSDKGP